MKILHTVESYLPARHGMSEVVRQISEHLVQHGHQVVVATRRDPNRAEKIINGVEVQEFGITGNLVNGIQGETDRYVRFLTECDFDLVANFAAQQWATDLALPVLGQIRGKKVLVPTGYSGLYLPEYQPYFERMKHWLPQYDRVVYLSDEYRDVCFAREHGINNGVLIPNGASKEEFLADVNSDIRARLGIPPDHLLILHVSGYVGEKGHLDAIRIFNQAKLKRATLLFVSPQFAGGLQIGWTEMVRMGLNRLRRIPNAEFSYLRAFNRFQSLGLFNPAIKFVALTRQETIAAYQSADIFLFPSHLECSPIVLFECLASRTPFLSTDVGNAAEIARWAGSGLILPTRMLGDPYRRGVAQINESATILRDFATKPELRLTMAQSGYQSWLHNFTWEAIAEKYENLYRDLVHATR